MTCFSKWKKQEKPLLSTAVSEWNLLRDTISCVKHSKWLNNKWLPCQDVLAVNCLNFGQLLEVSMPAVKFSDISRFSRQIVTDYHANVQPKLQTCQWIVIVQMLTAVWVMNLTALGSWPRSMLAVSRWTALMSCRRSRRCGRPGQHGNRGHASWSGCEQLRISERIFSLLMPLPGQYKWSTSRSPLDELLIQEVGT